MTDIEKLLNEKYKNNGAYKVPDGYFNTLNIRINERIQHQKSKRNRLFTIPPSVQKCLEREAKPTDFTIICHGSMSVVSNSSNRNYSI